MPQHGVLYPLILQIPLSLIKKHKQHSDTLSAPAAVGPKMAAVIREVPADYVAPSSHAEDFTASGENQDGGQDERGQFRSRGRGSGRGRGQGSARGRGQGSRRGRGRGVGRVRGRGFGSVRGRGRGAAGGRRDSTFEDPSKVWRLRKLASHGFMLES